MIAFSRAMIAFSLGFSEIHHSDWLQRIHALIIRLINSTTSAVLGSPNADVFLHFTENSSRALIGPLV